MAKRITKDEVFPQVDLTGLNDWRKTINPQAEDLTEVTPEQVQWAQQNGYNPQSAPATNQSAPANTLEAGINNKAVNTSTTTESVDFSGVNDRTNQIIKAMQDEGLTYAQAYQKFNPKPVRDVDLAAQTRKAQKYALFSDMLRLTMEGVGASKGATVNRRDQSQPYSYLHNKLATELATYQKNLTEWQAKGVEAVMKDVQMRNDIYSKNLANAPKTRTTVENKEWDRQRFEIEQSTKEKEMKQRKEIADADRNAANFRDQNNDKSDKTEKYVEVPFVDNKGGYTLPKESATNILVATYEAMLQDPEFIRAKGSPADIEKTLSDYDGSTKAERMRNFAIRNAHLSPKAQELLRKNSQSYSREETPEATPARIEIPGMFTPPGTQTRSRAQSRTTTSTQPKVKSRASR